MDHGARGAMGGVGGAVHCMGPLKLKGNGPQSHGPGVIGPCGLEAGPAGRHPCQEGELVFGRYK